MAEMRKKSAEERWDQLREWLTSFKEASKTRVLQGDAEKLLFNLIEINVYDNVLTCMQLLDDGEWPVEE